MSEMIERVARAIRGSWGYDFDTDPLPGGQESFLYQARAAIEAMREPTTGMVTAAETHDPNNPWYKPRIAWGKMIDAALADDVTEDAPELGSGVKALMDRKT